MCGNIHRVTFGEIEDMRALFWRPGLPTKERSTPRVLVAASRGRVTSDVVRFMCRLMGDSQRQWWLDGCSSRGCLAFGAVFRGGREI